MSGPEERERAVDLYSAMPMTAAQVVGHLGYPTRRSLERWLVADPRYAGHMAKPIIPLETRAKGGRAGAGRHAAEAGRPGTRRGRRHRPQPGRGMPQERHGRAAGREQGRRAERQARVRAAAKPECRGRQRRHGGAAPQGRGTGAGGRGDVGGGGGRRKGPGRRPAAPVGQGGRPC